jgi:alpha,alpha-trehalase
MNPRVPGAEFWVLDYEEFIPAEQGVREALCTLGNGYFATRGAFPEADPDGIHYPGCYLAGCYNRLVSEIGGKAIENEDLVNLPNWLSLKFRIADGEWFNLRAVEILSFRQELNLRHAILSRQVRFRDSKGRISVLRHRQLIHMEYRHLAAISWELTAENWTGEVQVVSALDGRLANAGVARYRDFASKHLLPVAQGALGDQIIWLKVTTSQSEVRVAQAARTRVAIDGERIYVLPDVVTEPGCIAAYYLLTVPEGRRIVVEKTVALYSSRDFACSEAALEAQDVVSVAPDFEELEASQRLYWAMLWQQCDIEVHTAAHLFEWHPMLILRFHIFHLLQTASPNTIDLDTGVPARGWHGEAYRGHIFWDELFIFPFLNLRMPKITGALLKYRARRLPWAKRAAAEAGWAGAMYPWQSGSNGREETQRVHLNPQSGRWLGDNSSLQRHVNGAIAYNLWRYYQATYDIEFMIAHGGEMILEIARFFASIATFNPSYERYEILRVMGPDEYHDAYPWSPDRPGIDNNAYTNLLAVWVLCRALDVLEVIPSVHASELRRRLNLTSAEEERWLDITRRMRLVFHDGDIISQFEGYDKLAIFSWAAYRKKYSNIQRLDRILEAEGDSINRYQASKQADVLMLFYLFTAETLQQLFARLDYPFEPGLIQRNIRYYLQRTADGSTLSRIVHAWVLARADRAGSWQLFLDALGSDIIDIQDGTTAEGIHLGAMAGTIDIIQRAYTGIETFGDVLRFDPTLPESVTVIRFEMHYRGHTLLINATPEQLTVVAHEGAAAPIQISYRDKVYELRPGTRQEISLK